MSNSKGICINLDNSRSARAFSGQESLWAKDLFRVLKLIALHTDQLPESRKTEARTLTMDQQRLSVAIFGPSGSGKSSLLHTLHREVVHCHRKEESLFSAGRVLEHLNEKTSTNQNQPTATENQKNLLSDLHDNVATLPILRPDTFAEDDQFLYAFLARALEADREANSDRNRSDSEPEVLSPLQREFQELSDFLRVLDPTEKTQDYDPLGLSLERMERHTSGLLLRDKLGRFIDALAHSLKCKVLLLPVDDVDMSPEHMVEILKIYQSFLIHPRLVPIFTFTDRTAEEVLRVHYLKFLSGGMEVYDEPGEGTNRLNVSEKLSLQYLARCFPVRNRIRLGPAPARLQQARFVSRRKDSPSQRGSNQSDATPVLALLKTANFLLFGHHDWQTTHEVRAILRPSTLRRQLHVMDALVEAEIEKYIVDQFRGGGSDNSIEHRREPWARVYNGATWALINVHRDVLREYDLFLEDLYSWSPRALRGVVLETLLAQPIDVRRSLLRRWRDRADSRRSQALSLLAANVFRPWTPVEEAYGDDEYAFAPRSNIDFTPETEGQIGLRTDAVLQWFLEVTIGFYMPLALARPQQGRTREANPSRRRVIGIGWDLESGPVNAVRDADERENILPTGICFLNPQKFGESLAGIHPPKEQTEGDATQPHNELTLRLWCFYGFSRGRVWSAVSFWRGLGLIARVLDRHRRLRYELETLTGQKADDEAKIRKRKWPHELRVLIRHHLLRGIVPAGMLGKICDEERLRGTAFKPWDSWAQEGEQSTDAIEDFVNEMVKWLGSEDRKAEDGWKNELLPSMPPPDAEASGEEKFGWRNNFTRRLHGSDILGDFWQRLAAAYIEEQDHYPRDQKDFGWTAGVALLTWTNTLLDYWRGVYMIQRLLRSCPLLRSFTIGPTAEILRKRLLNKSYSALQKRSTVARFPDLDMLLKDGLKEGREKILELNPKNIFNSAGEESRENPDSDPLIEMDELAEVVSGQLKKVLKNRLSKWAPDEPEWTPDSKDAKEKLSENELKDHWYWIGAPYIERDGKKWVTTINAQELFYDQIRELFWANNDLLMVRSLWDLERVRWEDFAARKEESWIRANIPQLEEREEKNLRKAERKREVSPSPREGQSRKDHES